MMEIPFTRFQSRLKLLMVERKLMCQNKGYVVCFYHLVVRLLILNSCVATTLVLWCMFSEFVLYCVVIVLVSLQRNENFFIRKAKCTVNRSDTRVGYFFDITTILCTLYGLLIDSITSPNPNQQLCDNKVDYVLFVVQIICVCFDFIVRK